jgi:hypothetical protein
MKQGSSPFLQPVFLSEHLIGNKPMITDRLSRLGVALAPSYNCFVHNWQITKDLGVVTHHEVAERNYRRAFNLFLNEKCGRRHLLLLEKAFRSVLNSF